MGIINAFQRRHPLIVFLSALFVSPSIGFAYINRGWFAIGFLIFSITLPFVQEWLKENDFLKNDMVFDFIYLTVYLIAALYCLFLAVKYGSGDKIKWYATLSLWLIIVSFFIYILAHPIRSFLYEPFNIPSAGMEPTFQIGDVFLLDKRIYGYSRYSLPFHWHLWSGKIMASKPLRGDVVLFALPSNTKVEFIKRIVGLPRDSVQMKEGKLYINDMAVKEDLVSDYKVQRSDIPEKNFMRMRETLAEGQSYYILNTDGTSPLDNTPVYHVPEGHYFVLGDNRDFSMDSRVTDKVGFIPEEYIIGKPAYLIYSGQEEKVVFRKIE